MQNDSKPEDLDLNDDLGDDLDDIDLIDLDDEELGDLDDLSWDEDEDSQDFDSDLVDDAEIETDDSNTNPAPRKKKTILPIIVLLLLVALGGGGWFYLGIQGKAPIATQVLANNENSTTNTNWPAQEEQNQLIEQQPVEQTAIDPFANQDLNLPMPSPVLSHIDEEELAPAVEIIKTPIEQVAQAEVLTPMPSQNNLAGEINLEVLASQEGPQIASQDPIIKPAVLVTPIDEIITENAFIPQAKKEIQIAPLEPIIEMPTQEVKEEMPAINVAIEPELIVTPESKEDLLIEATPSITETAQPITIEEVAPIEMPVNDIQLSNIQGEISSLEEKINASNGMLTSKISATEDSIQALSNSLSRLEANLEKLVELQSRPIVQTKQQNTAPTLNKTQPVKDQQTVTPPSKKPAYTPIKKVKNPVKKANKSHIWQLRSAQPGVALISEKGSNDYLSIRVGDKIPSLGQVFSINLEHGKWIVKASKGNIYQ